MKKSFILFIMIVVSLNVFATNTKITPKELENMYESKSYEAFVNYLEDEKNDNYILNIGKDFNINEIYNKDFHKLVNLFLKNDNKSISKKDILKLTNIYKTKDYDYIKMANLFSFEQNFYLITYNIFLLRLAFDQKN